MRTAIPKEKEIVSRDVRGYIDMHDPREVRRWCRVLNCSELQLRYTVKAVGNAVSKVKKHLQPV